MEITKNGDVEHINFWSDLSLFSSVIKTLQEKSEEISKKYSDPVYDAITYIIITNYIGTKNFEIEIVISEGVLYSFKIKRSFINSSKTQEFNYIVKPDDSNITVNLPHKLVQNLTAFFVLNLNVNFWIHLSAKDSLFSITTCYQGFNFYPH